MSVFATFSFFVSFLAAGASAFAACKDVRLDTEGGPFAKIPIYDQQKFSVTDPGICYAVTAAQLQDADRFFRGDHELNQLTSPISLAGNEKIAVNTEGKKSSVGYFPETTLGDGQEQDALLASQGKQVCDQRYLERFIPLFGQSIRNPLPASALANDTVSSVENFVRSLTQEKNAMAEMQAYYGNPVAPLRDGEFCNQYVEARLGFGQNLKELRTAISHSLNQQDIIDQISGSVLAVCKDHSFTMKSATPVKFDGFTPEELARYNQLEAEYMGVDTEPARAKAAVKEMNALLDPAIVPRAARMSAKIEELLSGENPVPVGIGYNARVLYGGNDVARHASVIVGERPDASGKCEYLIRDSYGPTCTPNGESYVYPCIAGEIWIPAEKLKSQTLGLTWIPR